jgi:hypothetical protein
MFPRWSGRTLPPNLAGKIKKLLCEGIHRHLRLRSASFYARVDRLLQKAARYGGKSDENKPHAHIELFSSDGQNPVCNSRSRCSLRVALPKVSSDISKKPHRQNLENDESPTNSG